MKLFSSQRTSITRNKLGEWRYVWLQSSLKMPDIFKKKSSISGCAHRIQQKDNRDMNSNRKKKSLALNLVDPKLQLT
jgi:hypothetical protein